MSAFVVTDTTINHVLTWLQGYDNQNAWPRRELAEMDTDPDVLGWPAVGQRMFDLNVRAVDARYGEGEAAKFRPLDYHHEYKQANLCQVYKSLCCWLYQCSEGDVPDDPLYQFGQKLKDSLAYQIIGDLPAYEAATWD